MPLNKRAMARNSYRDALKWLEFGHAQDPRFIERLLRRKLMALANVTDANGAWSTLKPLLKTPADIAREADMVKTANDAIAAQNAAAAPPANAGQQQAS